MLRRVYKAIFGSLFKLFGWKLIKGKPEDLKKYVIAVAPHTSNWDFAVGYCIKFINDLHPNFLAKDSLFTIPFVGWFLKNMGGVPVNRSKKTNMVDQVVQKFAEMEQFIMAIAPEGTRSFSPEWKTGFYRIALKAEVPIVLAGFDYGRKVVEFSDPIYLTGDMDKEIEEMKVFFRKLRGRYPEKGVI